MTGKFFLLLAVVLSGALLAHPAWAAAGGEALAADTRPMDLLVAALAILLVVSGLVSGSETAIFSLSKIDVMHIRQQPTRGGRALIYLLDSPTDTLTTILVLNNVVNVGLSLTAGAMTDHYFADGSSLGFAVAALGATTLILIFGEVVPKCVSHVKARPVALTMAWPVASAAWLLAPVRRMMNAFIRLVFRAMKIPESRLTDQVSEEEFKALIGSGEMSNLLEEDEREMIHGIFELDQTFAHEIMTPRGEVSALPDTLSQAEMLERLAEIGHSRILIYHDDLDNLVGFVLAKEVLLNPERPWQEALREMLCIPARLRLIDLLKQFRRSSTKIAAVVDEYGGVAGIVSRHDLLEEIVGEIAERHEKVIEEFQEMGESRWLVRGQMKLSDLSRRLGVEFPADLGSTLGGFVMNKLGHVPSTGSELVFDGMRMKVVRMVGRRILQVEIDRTAEAEVEADAGNAEPLFTTETRGTQRNEK